MYEKLPLDFIGVTELYGTRKDPITGVSTYHYGVDFGWHSYRGEPVYSIYDSKVVYEGFDNNLGNYIVLTYKKNNRTIIYRFLHLKNRAIVKKDQTVKRGQIIGYMGTTGYSTGVHLHFEYWICPKDYSYKYSDRSKYAVNPLNYVYLFDDQTASSSSASLLKKVVGNEIKKETDDSAKQIEVINKHLNCRESPSLKGKILGYIDYGIYNILDEKKADNYIWYQIDINKWIANVVGDIKIHSIKTDDNTISLLNYTSFKCPKDGYYHILLKSNEIIYFPK